MPNKLALTVFVTRAHAGRWVLSILICVSLVLSGEARPSVFPNVMRERCCSSRKARFFSPAHLCILQLHRKTTFDVEGVLSARGAVARRAKMDGALATIALACTFCYAKPRETIPNP